MRTVLGTCSAVCLGTFLAVASLGSVGCGGGSPQTGQPGAGGNGGASANAFRLTGKVQRTLASPPLSPTDDTPSDTARLDAKTVTHVLAVNPSSQDFTRVVSPVAADGSFALALEAGHPWVLVFVDSTRIGADMIAGIFRASTLDTIAPAMPGTGDLGMVEVAPDGTATGGIAYADLLVALHLSPGDAELLGAADDVCLRYVNPDIDGDGMMDRMQPGHDFMLDFHVQFALRAGDPNGPTGGNASIADIVGSFLPPDTQVGYRGVGIYASQPAAFAIVDAATAWATFEGPITYYPGGTNPTPRTAAAGERIPGADLMFSNFGGDARSQGISAAAGADLPQGGYTFGVGARTLTFTNVRTHTDAQLADAADFIVPFIRLLPTDATCTSDCNVVALEYRWMKRGATGWVPATRSELNLIVSQAGGTVSIVKGFDNGNQHVSFTIPAEEPAGIVDWAGGRVEGLSAAELSAMTTRDVCHLGLSYDDKLGMRMFSAIANAPGTCPRM